MLARDVMTHPVITVPADIACTSASAMLIEHGFTGAPVVDDNGALVGIVTEADLLGGRILPDPRRGDPHHTGRFGSRPPVTVAEVMTTPVESLTPGADIADAVRIMLDEKIRTLPIVDGRHLVGIITRRDLLRAAIAHNDDELRALIVRRLVALDSRDRWEVSVQAGVANISDHLDNARDRAAAARVAETIPGVVHAEAHHVTSDPF